MIVHQLNTSLSGGAATAAIRLHQSLRETGIESHYWYGERERSGEAPPHAGRLNWRCWSPQTLRRRIQIKQDKLRYLKNRPAGCEIFTDPRRASPTPRGQKLDGGDLLHLHWVSKWLDLASFFGSIPASMPVIWTLHDMNPMTGGCHHSDGCTRFREGCGHCPQLAPSRPSLSTAWLSSRSSSPGDDLSARLFELKRASLAGKQLHIVTPSRWMERQVRQSAMFANAASVQTIHNGLDLNLFRPIGKVAARKELGIAADARVVGFGAASLANRRKGFAEVLDALHRLPSRDSITGLAFGSSELPNWEQTLPPIQMLGYIDDPRRQAIAYSAMDLFVLPSWAENMPQTVVEAMACGVPVVAFDVGGVPEIVRPSETGELVPLKDSRTLSATITRMMEDPDSRRVMGQNARRLVEQRFELRTQGRAIAELYRRALDLSRRSSRADSAGRTAA